MGGRVFAATARRNIYLRKVCGLDGRGGYVRRPVRRQVNHITPTVLATLSSLPERLFEEEQELFMQAQQ